MVASERVEDHVEVAEDLVILSFVVIDDLVGTELPDVVHVAAGTRGGNPRTARLG